MAFEDGMLTAGKTGKHEMKHNKTELRETSTMETTVHLLQIKSIFAQLLGHCLILSALFRLRNCFGVICHQCMSYMRQTTGC